MTRPRLEDHDPVVFWVTLTLIGLLIVLALQIVRVVLVFV